MDKEEGRGESGGGGIAKFGRLFRLHYGEKYLHHAPEVWIKVEIKRIWDFDPINMTVHLDYVIMLDWVDKSIDSIPKNLRFKAANHFTPYVILDNIVGDKPEPVDDYFDIRVKDEEKCWVGWTQRFRAVVHVDMNFENYPFDGQIITLNFRSRSKGDSVKLRGGLDLGKRKSEQLRLENNSDTSNYTLRPKSYHSLEDSQLLNWKLLDINGKPVKKEDSKSTEIKRLRSTPLEPGQSEADASIEYVIQVYALRNPYSINCTVFMPIAICTLLGLCSFVRAAEVNEGVDTILARLGVIVTLLLAVMGFQTYSHDKLPSLPYLTVLDIYSSGSIAFLLIIGIFHVMDDKWGTHCVSPKCSIFGILVSGVFELCFKCLGYLVFYTSSLLSRFNGHDFGGKTFIIKYWQELGDWLSLIIITSVYDNSKDCDKGVVCPRWPVMFTTMNLFTFAITIWGVLQCFLVWKFNVWSDIDRSTKDLSERTDFFKSRPKDHKLSSTSDAERRAARKRDELQQPQQIDREVAKTRVEDQAQQEREQWSVETVLPSSTLRRRFSIDTTDTRDRMLSPTFSSTSAVSSLPERDIPSPRESSSPETEANFQAQKAWFDFLESSNLDRSQRENYAQSFANHRIKPDMLEHLTDQHFAELGVLIGDRLEIMSPHKRKAEENAESIKVRTSIGGRAKKSKTGKS